jgi:hypothetical protein
MFHIRAEGELIKNGFNFYPLRDRRSVGFIFKLGKFNYVFRFSKLRHKLNAHKIKH